MLGFNIALLFGLFVPPLIYAVIIYFTSPYRSVSFKNGILFMMGGIISVTLLQLIYILFPTMGFSHKEFFLRFFMFVGPLEEISKFIMYIVILNFIDKNKVSEHPFRYMFYFSLVGLGFAAIENIGYVKIYGENVLYVRTFTSTIMHMIFGLLFGYWIGLATINKRKFGNRSVFGVITNKHKKLRMFIYALIGFISATLYHGLWNYNLSTSKEASDSIMIMLIIAGLLACKLLADDLNSKWRRNLQRP